VRRRPLAPLALACLLATLLVACSETDGRILPPADPSQTTTTPSTPVIQSSEGPAEVFTLRSPSFLDGGALPDELTCRGAGASPGLTWTGVPDDAVALAIVARDKDDGGYVHWVVTGIDPAVQGIGVDGVPEGAVEGQNEAGRTGWLPPCPPPGSGLHSYDVQLLALTAVVILPEGASAEQAATLLETSAGERAVLTGTVTAAP
jgi:Raf kinase inhibitor-like YbhB/YbcL family protein